MNTESRVVPQNYQRARGYSNITPKKLTYNGQQTEARYRDFTSIGAIAQNETGIAFEFNGAVFQYGADQRSFLDRLCNQDYQGLVDHGWDSYVNECSKELDFVDQVLATGGRGQGETITIPKDYASNPNFDIANFIEKKTILLDLDETLVHADSFQDNKIYDIVIDMAESGERQDVSFYKSSL